VLAAAAALFAVVLRRPDLLVLATPFLLVASWAWLTRPKELAALDAAVAHSSLREGETSRWVGTVNLPDGAEDVLVGLAPGLFLEYDPPLGATAVPVEDAVDGAVRAVVGFRTTRWGVRPVGPAVCSVSSAWGAYRTGPTTVGELTLTTLPHPAVFDPSAPMPHPEGLVGLGRSARQGNGSEFNSLRPFQQGDRLRRIHWPVSLRTGNLHVSSTYGDEDSHVALLIDAFSDIGPREGIDGRPTSLDLTVRAAGAMAEHYLGVGDRVSLRVVGASSVPRLPVRSGRAHLRRMLETLALIQPATERQDNGQRATSGLAAGALVVVLSPLVDPSVVGIVGRLGSQGLSTVVVDTMPEHLWAGADDPYSTLAWRVRRLTRENEVNQLTAAGIPVVPWRGPASLDQVLRDVSRRARAPRLARR
jgi:uncharacterized protein (DUF58 family)